MKPTYAKLYQNLENLPKEKSIKLTGTLQEAIDTRAYIHTFLWQTGLRHYFSLKRRGNCLTISHKPFNLEGPLHKSPKPSRGRIPKTDWLKQAKSERFPQDFLYNVYTAKKINLLELGTLTCQL